jgi:hypothetical protein
MTNKISDLVHAGKYADAQKLTVAMLIVYPGDQRLIKAKALIDQLLAPPPAAATPPVSSPPVPAPNLATDTLPAEPDVPSSSSPPPEAEGAAKLDPAILHIYRLSRFAGSASGFGVYLDGAKVASLHNGQATEILVLPGKHSISVSAGGVKARKPIDDFELDAGKEYWMRAGVSLGPPTISVVSNAVGATESSKLRETAAGVPLKY